MNIDELKSIVCINNHCFDISRSGYLNLLLKPSKTQYDKELFESRDITCNMGFFHPLIEEIVNIIDSAYDNIGSEDPINILDAGCGEGFHLSKIVSMLHEKRASRFHGVGIDISKDGIQIASKRYKHVIWCVADLANIPFMDKKFNVILNILSPSNYNEFDRLLSSDGILIKVVPGSDYLKELRNVYYKETDKKNYSNTRVVDRFSEKFKLIDTKNLSYKVGLRKEELKHLIKMTPLSWGVSDKVIREALNQNIDNTTADFTIMVGRCNGN